MEHVIPEEAARTLFLKYGVCCRRKGLGETKVAYYVQVGRLGIGQSKPTNGYDQAGHEGRY